VIASVLSYRHEQLILKKAKLLPTLLELIKTSGNCDPWVQIGLRLFYPEFRQQLESLVVQPESCIEHCGKLSDYYQLLELPIEEAQISIMKLRMLAVETLANAGNYQDALILAKQISPKPKELILRFQKALNKNAPDLIPSIDPVKKPLGEVLKTQVIDLGNGITLDLTLIPAGSFLMGSPTSEKHRFINETLHKVAISKPFYLGTVPVTQEQWEVIMGNIPVILKAQSSLLPMYLGMVAFFLLIN